MKTHKVLRQKCRSALRLAKKLGRTLITKGFSAAAQVLATALQEYTPAGRQRTAMTSDFDRRYGIDTSGVVRIASMKISSPNYIYGTYYKATKAEAFLDALKRIEPRYEAFTFVDYGSGKGLALLLASQFPFRRIVGVEFARDLHEIAVRNIANIRNPNQHCRDITSVCSDAADFPVPDEPLICYFYDPFEAPVLERVVALLTASWRRLPRPMLILYHGAGQDSILRDAHHQQKAIIGSSGVFESTGEWGDGTWSVYAAVKHSTAGEQSSFSGGEQLRDRMMAGSSGV